MNRHGLRPLRHLFLLALCAVAPPALLADDAPPNQTPHSQDDQREGPYLNICGFRGSLLIDHPVAAVWCQGVPWYDRSCTVCLIKFPFTEATDWSPDVSRAEVTHFSVGNTRLVVSWSRPKGRVPATVEVTYGTIHHKITFPNAGGNLRVNIRKQTFDLRNHKPLILVAPNGNAAQLTHEALRIQAFEHAAAIAEKTPTFEEEATEAWEQFVEQHK